MNYETIPGRIQFPSIAAGSGRVNWLSALVGFAMGLVLASLAWVQILPAKPTSGAGDLVAVGSGDAIGPGSSGPSGATTRRITRNGHGLIPGADGTLGTNGTRGTNGTSGQESGVGSNVNGGGNGGGQVQPGAPGGSVTETSIKLGATYVGDGLAKAFLGEVRYGMEAVRKKVNSSGGINHRTLNLLYREDGWNASTGQTYIQNLISNDKVFALAVSPSSEGLNAASNAGVFACSGTPVIGADGLNNSQFINLGNIKDCGVARGGTNAWVWPVAAATTTQVHAIIKDAAARAGGCANLRPAITFGNTYRFGVEGAYAFEKEYERECGGSGHTIPGYRDGETGCQQNSRYCGVAATDTGNTTIGGSVSTLMQACKNSSVGGGRCNFLMVLLEPKTAEDWMASMTQSDVSSFSLGLAGAQPLFTSGFATACKSLCNGMRVWTGYNPPLGANANKPGVQEYVHDLNSSSNSTADIFNQFTLGGYLGMKLLVGALGKLGDDITKPDARSRLVNILNGFTLSTDLAPSTLRWSADSKYANIVVRAYTIQYASTFNGWAPGQTVTDPSPGKDNLPPG